MWKEFGPFGHYFASASHDRTARIWSMDRIQPLRIMAGHLSDVDCVQWHANCNYIATGSSDKTVRLWDVQTGESVRIFIGHRSMILSLAMSPDGRYLASGDEDGTIMMWDLSTGRCVSPLMGHNSCVWTLAFSCEGTLLASGSADGTVKLWDVTSSNKATKMDDNKGSSGNRLRLLKAFPTKSTPVYTLQLIVRQSGFMATAPVFGFYLHYRSKGASQQRWDILVDTSFRSWRGYSLVSPPKCGKRRTLVYAVNQDAEKSFKKTLEVDRLIDTLRVSNPAELEQLVVENVLAFNEGFWIRLAARTETYYEELAASVMSIVDRLVHKANEKIESATDILKAILRPVVDGVREVSWPPQNPEALKLMEEEVHKREREGQLDEGFLAEVNAQLRQATEDGDKPGLAAMLQKVLQLYASKFLGKRSYAYKGGEVLKAEKFLESIIEAPEERWDKLLIEGLNLVSPEELYAVIKKRIERVLIRTEGGSYQQRILTEYLKGIQLRTEGVWQGTSKYASAMQWGKTAKIQWSRNATWSCSKIFVNRQWISFMFYRGEVLKAEKFLESIIEAPEERWDKLLIEGLNLVSPEELYAVIKKRIERVLIRTEGGSYQQRILTEYLKGIQLRTEGVFFLGLMVLLNMLQPCNGGKQQKYSGLGMQLGPAPRFLLIVSGFHSCFTVKLIPTASTSLKALNKYWSGMEDQSCSKKSNYNHYLFICREMISAFLSAMPNFLKSFVVKLLWDKMNRSIERIIVEILKEFINKKRKI
ncbi:hypothetical protein M5K25_009967 [Dendrobium thyrsiflorum]|uniref:Uncharacterized protein n=1 Tax=Dendrobium thyrsiflorum TaxID=117978 RepID=A0ABD0V860_DENTH